MNERELWRTSDIVWLFLVITYRMVNWKYCELLIAVYALVGRGDARRVSFRVSYRERGMDSRDIEMHGISLDVLSAHDVGYVGIYDLVYIYYHLVYVYDLVYIYIGQQFGR